MIVHDAIFSRLNTSSVTTLVSTRIFPEIAPQDQVLPYVVFRVVDTQPRQIKDGAAKNNVYTVEAVAFAKTFSSAQAIIDAVSSRLDYWTGSQSGITIRQCRVDSKNNLPFVAEQEVFGTALLARVFTYES
jgi:hypothetical protein